ncbi:MAG: DUF86 domain-containing protein [Paenibacillaceae bacterium]
MTGDVIINKMETIKRCIKRIREEYDGDPTNLNNYTKQDSIILNLQRACEASIDLAMHVVAEMKLGVPQNSRDAFDMLQEHHVIESELCQRLKAMVGFRNIAVHDYQAVKNSILKSIIDHHLDDFIVFSDRIKRI